MTDVLTVAILQALAESPEAVSLPRLGKRLGLGASVLLRRLHGLSDASIAGQAGPGWVVVASDDGRWMARLTEAGRLVLPSLKEARDHA